MKKWSARMLTGIENMTRKMRAGGTCRTDEGGPACRRGEARGAWYVLCFGLLALQCSFLVIPTSVCAAEAVTNGILNGSTNWTLAGDGTYDAGTTRTADGSGSANVNSAGRNKGATGTLTQTLGTSIPAGSTIDAVAIYAQTAGSGTYDLSLVTIDLEYSDLTTLNVFTGTMPTPTYAWSSLSPNTATVPVTTSATLAVTSIIVTYEIKNGNDPGANYNLNVDDISIVYTAPSANNPPSLTINQPDGIGDSVTVGDSFNVDYDLSDAEDTATVDFFYDTDGNGAGGTAIGTCANHPEGAGQTCAWNTTAVTPGDYYVYGVADDTVNTPVTVVSSGVLTINAAASCTAGPISISLAPASQLVSPGDSVVYTVDVTNGDSGGACAPLDLTLSITGNTGVTTDFDVAIPVLSATSVTGLAAGANDNSITLTVTADADGTNGSALTTEVTVSAASKADQLDSIVTTIQLFNPLIHNSSSTGSTYWLGDWGVTATSKYGKFTCDTCHIKGALLNIKRIKQTITAPNSTPSDFPGAAQTIILTTTDQTANPAATGFGDDSDNHTLSNKVCEACHSLTRFHRYDTTGQTELDHYNNQDCINCHLHKSGFKASCDTCHGNPPTANTLGGPDGLANDPTTTGSATFGAHPTHTTGAQSYVCNTCHTGWETSGQMPNNGQVNIGFDAFGSNVGNYDGRSPVTNYNTNAPTTVTAGGTFDCTVYCHGGTIGGVDATWDSAAVVNCGDCHKATNADPPTLGSHPQHAGNGAGQNNQPCADCHGAGYVAGTTAPSDHVSGTVLWNVASLAGTSPQYNGAISGDSGALAPSAAYATCTGIYCHSDGAGGPPAQVPEWGDATTAECGDCHAIAPNSNAHPEHYAAKGWTADGSNCINCHDSSAGNHVNGSLDILAARGWNSGAKTCSSTPDGCHNTQSTPAWTIGTPIDCADCHTAGGSNSATVANPASGLHNLTAANTVAHDGNFVDPDDATVYDCEDCHVKASISGHWDEVAGGNPPDFTGADVGISGTLYTDAGGVTATRGSCLSTSDLGSCHSDGGNWRRLWSTDADIDIVTNPNPGQAACNVCHGQESTLTASAGWNEGTVHYRSGTGAAEDKGFTMHTDPAPDNCEDCHAYDSAAVHNSNKAIDFSGGGTSFTLQTGDHATNPGWYCSTCHDGNKSEDAALTGSHTFFDSLAFPNNISYVTGGSEPEGACDSCHGGSGLYWPQDSSGTAVYPDRMATHATHIAALEAKFGYSASTTDDTQQKHMCEYCHNDLAGVGGVNHWIPEVAPADVGSFNPLWDTANPPVTSDTVDTYNAGDVTCAINCHNSKLTAAGTFGWYDGGGSGGLGGDCTMCHTPGGHANDFGNPTTGLHDITPSVSGTTHDSTLATGCEVCHTMPAISSGSSHVNGTFVADSTGNTDRGLYTDYTEGQDTAGNYGSCLGTSASAAGCHDGAGEYNSGNGWERLWSSTAVNTDGSECANCHGGINETDWTFTLATAGNTDHNRDWDGDETAGEVIGFHSGNTDETDRCRSCHVYPDAPYNDTWGNSHGNDKIDMNSTVGYQAGSWDCTASCHVDNTGHNLEDSTWQDNSVAGPALDCLDCHNGSSGGLAVTASSPHAQNNGNFNFAGTTVTTGTSSQGCKDCHFDSHATQTTGTVNIPNNTAMSIDYSVSGGSGIYLKIISGSATEAETCWNCHEAATSQSSPFEFNGTGAWYKEGTTLESSWISGTNRWSSSTFAYKGALQIHSTHDVGDYTGAYPVPASEMSSSDMAASTSSLKCSWCHDVHGIMNKPRQVSGQTFNASTGYVDVTWSNDAKVFLRGTWYSSPYKEDGAPGIGSGLTTGGFTFPANTGGHVDGNDADTVSGTGGADVSWSADPAGSNLVGPGHLVRVQALSTVQNDETNDWTDWPAFDWGSHIDDNVFGTNGFWGHNPTTNNDDGGNGVTLGGSVPIDYSSTTNLCMMCHGTLANLKSMWSGHNAVKGGTAADTNDIFAMQMAIHQHYMYQNYEGSWASSYSDTWYSGELTTDGWGTGSYYNWAVDLSAQAVNGNADTVETQAEAWPANLNPSAGTKQKYHQFTCSKCHTPHASANARLMLTNCMNRDTTGGTFSTFNDQQGVGRIVGTQDPSSTRNILTTLPQAQAGGGREVASDWLTADSNFNGQIRAVQCHNNMASGDASTFWQSIPNSLP